MVDFSASSLQSNHILMNILPASIFRFDTLPSTSTEAARRAREGAAEGLCIVAAEQTAGRGRLQRRWLSPAAAGLYFSIVLRPRIDERFWPLITLMASLAARDALLEACSLKTDIKWPNDVLANERKLCGILAETVDTEFGDAVVVGIGLNLADEGLPSELRETATTVESATGKPADSEAVLQALFRALEKRYESLQSSGGEEETIREWCKSSSYANGKRIRVSNGDEILEGTTRGLETDGGLRVETETGEIKIVRAGDVTMLRARESSLQRRRR